MGLVWRGSVRQWRAQPVESQLGEEPVAHIPLYQPTRPSRRRLSLRQIVALLAGAAAPLAIAGSVLGYGINAPASAPAGSPITTFFQADPVTQLAQILGSRPPAAPAAPPRAS